MRDFVEVSYETAKANREFLSQPLSVGISSAYSKNGSLRGKRPVRHSIKVSRNQLCSPTLAKTMNRPLLRQFGQSHPRRLPNNVTQVKNLNGFCSADPMEGYRYMMIGKSHSRPSCRSRVYTSGSSLNFLCFLMPNICDLSEAQKRREYPRSCFLRVLSDRLLSFFGKSFHVRARGCVVLSHYAL